jgi:hypothetical protein
MHIGKNKTAAIMIAILMIISIGASTSLTPTAKAHTPSWQIPTYAYIVAEPSPIGVGQRIQIYMWLDTVYGAAGGTTAAIGTNASTVSAALLANSYRFHNYKLTITAPDGTNSTQTFATVQDTTSNQYATYVPSQTGTYTFTFNYPGEPYVGYEKSILINDTYLPSSASTTITVQQNAIPLPVNSYPLPEAYWTHPIYGENTDWWTVSSNWLGSGNPVPAGYTSSTLFHGDAVGPQTGHVMWTKPLQFGGVVGGNQFVAGGSNPNGAVTGAAYFDGVSYQPRFTNPLIINGYLFYTEVSSFTGPTSGPTDAVDLRTGQVLWSKMIPPLSFGYIFNLWDPDQHGVYPPVLVAQIGGGVTGLPVTWEFFDAYTGVGLFNVTDIPGFAGQTGQTVGGQPATALTTFTVAGPNGEPLRYVFENGGTSANPSWYLAEWNMSKLWLYDVNPYTGGGSLSPDVVNVTTGNGGGNLVVNMPIPIAGESGTAPSGASVFIPYGSTITVNGSTTIAQGNAVSSANPTGKYDWNVSVPWLNTMPLQPAYNVNNGAIVPQVMQGNCPTYLAAGGVNPVSIVAANTGDIMLCRNGSLPTGYATTTTGYPQLPYTMFAVNLNASRGAIGSILWMKNYNPPAGNITLQQSAVDYQNRVFILSYRETMQWIAYNLDTGALMWGPTAPQAAFDYYGTPGVPTLTATLAYGKLYSMSFAGIMYTYDIMTGNLLWTYGNGGEGNSTYAGFATPYGVYPTFVQSIANGIVYIATDEHTIPDPLYKGSTTAGINATSGQEIWTLSDYPAEWSSSGTAYVVADGYATFMNSYDNNIYSVGRGPSATTVQAPLTAITAGDKVVIQGTVMDISAGTKQTQQAADFPSGVPAASDASMKDWMGYVYQQKPLPTNFTGVPVSIIAIDPNGNYITIGNAQTSANGLYSYTWTTPNVPGDYSIYATFAGTNGYWPSTSQTTVNVEQAASHTTAPTSTPVSTADQYFLPVSAILIIAIIIVGVLVALSMFRKRP